MKGGQRYGRLAISIFSPSHSLCRWDRRQRPRSGDPAFDAHNFSWRVRDFKGARVFFLGIEVDPLLEGLGMQNLNRLWDIKPQNRGRCWGVTPPCNPWTGILGCFCISFCTSVILSLLFLVICHFHFYSPAPSHLDTSHHIKRNHGFSSKSKIRACRPTTGFSVEGTSPTASTSKIQCRGHPALSRLSGHWFRKEKERNARLDEEGSHSPSGWNCCACQEMLSFGRLHEMC